MHLPPHPVWFWLISAAPFLAWLTLWIAAQNPKVSLKPLAPWLGAGYILFVVPYLLFGLVPVGNYRALRLVSGLAFWTCWRMFFWIRGRSAFETLRSPDAKWYSAWKCTKFSFPAPDMRILVRDIDAVSPWYVEKLGLRKFAETQPIDPGAKLFRFKADGRPVVLTTRSGIETTRHPTLFTGKIGKVREVLSARGVDVGAIEQDRQGFHCFQIHDPEGNAIEVVEER